MIEVKILYK